MSESLERSQAGMISIMRASQQRTRQPSSADACVALMHAKQLSERADMSGWHALAHVPHSSAIRSGAEGRQSAMCTRSRAARG